MAKSAAIPLVIGGFASIAIISGIEGESLAEVLKGEFGEEKHPLPNPAFKPGAGESSQLSGVTGSVEAPGEPSAKGVISPFPKSSLLTWGRSDKGVDGFTTPGSPLYAIDNGIVEIAHDPGGFGPEYAVLHIENDGAIYYGHSIPLVSNGTRVKKGEPIAQANTKGWGNQHSPGGFEIGAWENGPIGNGAAIRNWLISLPRI